MQSRKMLTLLIVVIGMLSSISLTVAQEDLASIQFDNQISQGTIDIILNRIIIGTDIEFDTLTGEFTIFSGEHEMFIRNDDDEIIFAHQLHINSDRKYELTLNLDDETGDIVLSSSESIEIKSIENDTPDETIEIPQTRLEDGGFVLGFPDAPITIVAFEDFLCPHCQRYEETIQQFIAEYVATGQARFEYRFLPAVDPTYSIQVPQYAECADILKPGSFWEAHDILFEIASTSRFNASSARTFAERMDLSYTELLECRDTANQVNIDMQLAQQLGVAGTPTVFVRYGDSAPQPTPYGTQPTLEQFGIMIESAQD